MKKFLVFLVAIIVVVCLGTTTYYFLRNDEIINFKTKEIYCNTGDTVTLKELGFQRIKKHKDTKIDYNASEEDVKSAITFDEKKGYYSVGDIGGDLTLVIKTTNKRFKEFKITFHVGNGEPESPYYIDDEISLSKIGSVYGLNKHYVLTKDIAVSNNFTTIGLENDAWVGFGGSFEGNGYSISGLKLNQTIAEGGLFSSINTGAVVKNLTIKDANISGSYNSVGVLAGRIDGKISNISIENSIISNAKDISNVGAVAGVINNTTVTKVKANTVAISESGNLSKLGGFAGVINKTLVQACYASNVTLTGDGAYLVGGFTGEFVIGSELGSIQQSYANVSSGNANFAGFIGQISKAADFDANKTTMLRYLVGNACVNPNGNVVKLVNVLNSQGSAFFTSFYDTNSAFYLIKNYSSVDEMASVNNHIFYQITPEDNSTVKNWDSNVWAISAGSLPELKLGLVNPEGVSGEYIRRNLNKIWISNLSQLVGADKKEYILTCDLTLPANWSPVQFANSTFDGKGHTITFAGNGNASLFGEVKNSTIKNVKLANVKTNSSANGALASSIESTDSAFAATIENVQVEYTGTSYGASIFGGIVGTAKNAEIKNCSVAGLNLAGESFEVGGIVGVAENSSISACNVDATLTGTNGIGGVVSTNNGCTITNVNGSVRINYGATMGSTSYVGGIVAKNNGVINNANMAVSINITNGLSDILTGGVVAENNGSISSVTITGEGIKVSEAVTVNMAIGGVAAYNNGKINNTNVMMSQIGSYNADKKLTVGGVAAVNNTPNSSISQVVVTSDIFGNTVGGVVAYMNSSAAATVDQVYIGKFNPSTKVKADNTIKGDRLVAGVVVDLSAGHISNVQTNSNIVGGTNSTISSLIVLIFPDGATLRNSTINSSFSGNGTFFMDTLRMVGGISVQGLNIQEEGRYNLYGIDAHSGSLQSVVVNAQKASANGVNNIKTSEFTVAYAAIYGIVDYQNTDESSYYKAVGDAEFMSSSTFKTDWYVDVKKGGFFGFWDWGWGSPKFSKQMTFEIGDVWVEGGGITLSFLSNVK